MSKKIWQVAAPAPAEFLAANSEMHPLILQLLYNRGLKRPADIQDFLFAENLHDPFLFRDMEAAVSLIIQHIKAGSQMVVYGDYDADGVTSAVVLSEALKILHAQVEVYLPDRVSEGYGLNKEALEEIASQGVKLVITVDTGIRNYQEVNYAKSLGLEIIITDHHVLPDRREDLPACPVIDPADVSDAYPWPYLAGVGVAFKLVSALLLKAELKNDQKKMINDKCLDLVALGTVADMVSLLGENRILVRQGLKVLNKLKRPGLKALVKVAKLNSDRPLEAWNIGWQLGPRLNAASRLAHANTAFALLASKDEQEADSLAAELDQRNLERQKITEDIMTRVEAEINADKLPLMIIAWPPEGEAWNEGVIGLVAGRIAEKYYRPTLIITRLAEQNDAGDPGFKGSGRSIEDFNLIAAVEKCGSYLHKYGGHPMACGFSLWGEKNLEAFKGELLVEAASSLQADRLFPKLKVEAELSLADINLELAEQLESLAPFGQNNPQPRLASYDLRLDDIVLMGFNGQHIKFRLSAVNDRVISDGKNFSNSTRAVWALAFGAAEEYKKYCVGDRVDLVYSLNINEFNGRREVQLKIIDIRLSQSVVDSGAERKTK